MCTKHLFIIIHMLGFWACENATFHSSTPTWLRKFLRNMRENKKGRTPTTYSCSFLILDQHRTSDRTNYLIFRQLQAALLKLFFRSAQRLSVGSERIIADCRRQSTVRTSTETFYVITKTTQTRHVKILKTKEGQKKF